MYNSNKNNLPMNTPEYRYAVKYFKRRVLRVVYTVASIVLIAVVAFACAYFSAKSSKRVESVVNISIAGIENHSTLEVLTIRTSEVIVDSAEENEQKIDAWTEYTGQGIFTLDVANSEFVIDQARRRVIVRTPDVVLSDNFTLDYGETRELFFNNNWTNDSYKDGADLAQSQLERAYTKILDTIANNPYYYDTARSSAERIITSLVKGFNKDINDLDVVVEVGVL